MLFRSVIQQESSSSWEEMYKVFNMGHRLEFYVPSSIANDIINISEKYGVEAKIIGKVEKSNGDKAEVVISGKNGVYTYTK